MTARATRIAVGFAGGPTLSARVKPGELERLRAAMNDPTGHHELEADDGTVLIALERVAYVRVENGGARMGFS